MTSRPSPSTSRLANMPTPPGSARIVLVSSVRQALATHTLPLAHAVAQSAVGATQRSGSPALAAAAHFSPAPHRPAQPRTPVATLVTVQSPAADGLALLARASRSSVVRVPPSPASPVAMYAMAGWPSLPIAIDA